MHQLWELSGREMPNAGMLIKPVPAKRKHVEHLEYIFPGIAEVSVALKARGNNGVVSVGDAVMLLVIRAGTTQCT